MFLKFKVNPIGQVFDVHIINGLGYGCDEEAIRLVKLLDYEAPKSRKLKVTTYKKLNCKSDKPHASTKATNTKHKQR